MNIAAHSGLGRHLDLRYRSNRIAVFGTMLAAALLGGVTWTTSGEIAFFATASTAVGVFLAWAIARELDPDHPGTAAIAMAAATILALLGPPATAVVAVLLIAIRILVGTVGAPLRPGDLVVLLAAAGYAGSRPEGWAAAGALVIAVAVAHRQRHRWLPAALGSVALTAALVLSPEADIGLASALSAALITLAVVGAAAAGKPAAVTSTTDFAGQTISADHVIAGRVTAALVVIATGLLGATATTLAPAVAALAGLALPRRRQTRETTPGSNSPRFPVAPRPISGGRSRSRLLTPGRAPAWPASPDPPLPPPPGAPHPWSRSAAHARRARTDRTSSR